MNPRPPLRAIDGGRQGRPARRTRDLADFADWLWLLCCYVPGEEWPPPEEWPFPPPVLQVVPR